MSGPRDMTDYVGLQSAIEREMSDEHRFVRFAERSDTGALSADSIKSIHHGKYMTCWRGVSLMKDPLDLTIVQQLLWELKPRTVFEFGAYKGGSALWLADILKMFGCESRVLSCDIDLSFLDPVAKESPDVTFIQGDLLEVDKCFPQEQLKSMPHPWFLSEDAHVNMKGVLEYFDNFTVPGDYICVEDTNPLAASRGGEGLVKQLGFTPYGPDKLNCLKEVMKGRPERYLVDQRYTDFYGYNATWNMNGYLKRV